MDRAGGRKVVFGFIFLAVGVTLALLLGDLPKNLMEFMIFLSAGFFLGNGVEHVAVAVSSKSPAAATVSAEAASSREAASLAKDEIIGKLDDLQRQTTAATEGVAVVQQAISFIIDKTGIGKK